MADITPVTPFKLWCLNEFPFIEGTLDAIDNYDLWCKIVQKLNEVIDDNNKVITLVKEMEKRLDELNLQEEVNNKLDEMVEDGTLAELINEKIFNELNTKVTNLENTELKSNLFLGAFFNGTTNKINFCVSNNGIDFSDILTELDIDGRDPNILYNEENKTFYLSVTTSGDTYDFVCYTSTDLINWTKHYVSLGILTGIRWAPELFFDKNGDLYATITAGPDESNFSLYLAKCNDIELLTFDARTPISVSQTNIIDGSIIYDEENSLYHLTCKNNTTSLQLIYNSSDLSSWTLINSDVLKTGESCEGGFIIKTNNKFTFYGDTWLSHGYYIMAQTEDLSNFNSFIRPNSLMNKRHGTICFIDNSECVSLITKLDSYKQMDNINKLPSQDFELSGTIESLIVYPNFIYRITANTIINKVINAYDLEIMPFYFAGSKSIYLTVNNVVNSQYETKSINKTIYNSAYSNEKLNNLSLIGNPVEQENNNLIDYDVEDNISISSGWNVTIYQYRRFKDHIHIDGDMQKTSSATSNVAFTITNGELRPTFNTLVITNNQKTAWLKPDGTMNMDYEVVNENHFFSFDYLCI